jgi:hypothetical protein
MSTIVNSSTSNPLPRELITAIRNVYKPAGIRVTNAAQRETESSEYSACRLELNGYTIAFRVAKTTPTKIGQFVTIWKRSAPSNTIAPLDIRDGITFVIVNVFDAIHRGQFIFGQKILLEKNIMSHNGKGGKLAIRVYPPWTKPIAKQAIKTQHWQLQYFLPFAADGSADATQVRKFFNM